MKLRRLLGLVAAYTAAGAMATPTLPVPPSKPKLLVVISVDELSADLFDEYRPQFTAGLARLAGGIVFRNGYQSHATTETCPGHSTILTGDRPARTGIVGNVWRDPSVPRADKVVYCAEDASVPGSDSDHYRLSAVNLRVPTLGDLLKRDFPDSRVVGIAGKDRSAVMMTGHSADQLWYWDGHGFAGYAGRPQPRTVAAANVAVARMLAAPGEALTPPPFCSAKAAPVAIAGHAPVGAGTLARAAGDADGFEASPQSDAAVLALSAGLVQELRLGQRGPTDILAVSLAAPDFVGHTYGTGGQEMCLELLELDREIGDFLAQLDRWSLDYAVVLTADHGALDIPERLRTRGLSDAARIDPQLTAKRIGERVAQTTGITGPILVGGGPSGDVYLSRQLKGAVRVRALAAVLAAYRAHPQVEAALSRQDIERAPLPSGDPRTWSLAQRVRASFDPERSGDLYVVLKPNITPIGHATGSVATHGSPWDYDRRVPIIFWRPWFSAATVEASAETVDVMPTLAAMIGLDVPPSSIDGKCLAAVPGVTCPPR
jgi:predicted AlkP superfamily pyrophosphatase or phosphodiesterase